MKNYYNIDFAKKKDEILNCKAYEPILNQIKERAEDALKFEYTADRLSNYLSYYETGRRRDEEYFTRRNNAVSLAIAYYLYNDERYLKELIDVINIILNEFTWILPAHVHMEENPSFDFILRRIDLFQAETARALTEISVLVSDSLPYYLNERIEYELRRRIIKAYQKYSYFHAAEDQLNNWSAVCAGGCATALLHFGTKAEIEEILPRLIKGLDRYLKGLTTDGCCQEGVGYWNFGFGSYISFARVLYNYSNGEIDYINLPTCQKLALFQQKARLNNNMTVSFADAGSDFSFDAGLTCYLKDTYEGILLPDLSTSKVQINSIMSVPNFFSMSSDYKADTLVSGMSYFPDAQWYINRQEKFCFAAKGGHNYEPHNHNDLGNFLIVVGDDMPLCDLGAPEYIKYDHYDDRMVNLNFSSKGHDVPIINGQYQMLGKEYKSVIKTTDENVFSLDLEGAYEQGLINKFNRTFTIGADGVALKDTFDYSEKTESITERFISRTEPKLSDGEINLGTASIIYDSDLYDVNVSLDYYNGHRTWSKSAYNKITVYIIDFTAKNGDIKEFDCKFNIN